MLIGTVLYYTPSGKRLDEMDRDVSAGYAQSASRKSPGEVVQWSCTNGDRRDVRYYRAGLLLTQAPWAEAAR